MARSCFRQPAIANMIVEAMVERGMGDRGVARGPGGPPHWPEPVSTGYAQIRFTGVHFDSAPFMSLTGAYAACPALLE